MDDSVNTRRIHLALENLPVSGDYRLVHYRIDAEHSNAYGVWAEQGKPEAPTAGQIAEIRSAEQLGLAEPVDEVSLNGRWEYSVELPMHAVSLLLLVPANDQAPAGLEWVKAQAETGFAGNRQILLKWSPAGEADFLRYQLQRRSGDGEFEPVADEAFLSTALFVDTLAPEGELDYRVRAVNASGMAGPWSDPISVAD
jgi:xylan 1,4-beta-xylosidase